MKKERTLDLVMRLMLCAVILAQSWLIYRQNKALRESTKALQEANKLLVLCGQKQIAGLR